MTTHIHPSPGIQTQFKYITNLFQHNYSRVAFIFYPFVIISEPFKIDFFIIMAAKWIIPPFIELRWNDTLQVFQDLCGLTEFWFKGHDAD